MNKSELYDLRLYCDPNLFWDALANEKAPQVLTLAGLLELPGLDSNQDKENQNPLVPLPNPFQGKLFTSSSSPRCSADCSDNRPDMVQADSVLTALVAAWPALPRHIRAAIQALVATVTPTTPPGTGPSGGGSPSLPPREQSGE